MFNAILQDPERLNRFCGSEEYGAVSRDRFGRFPYSASKYKDVLEPTISKNLLENGLGAEYERGRKFAVFLSHDIDILGSENALGLGARCVKTAFDGTLRGAANRVKTSLQNRTFLDIEHIMEMESQYGAKSSFYFLAVDRNSPDFSYHIEEQKETLRYIHGQGWEVGLHGSQAAHDNVTVMKREKQALESALGGHVVGYRNHFLRFSTPLTWWLLEEAGFSYDTTYGYADMVGFRNGTCHPFKPYDIENGKKIDLLEVPLVIMDRTLFDDYMALDPPGAWDVIRKLIDIVEEHNGVLTVLWHNYSMRVTD
jgi:peptidoglycan/xylan/chitin deacetylase (PgdA/CDA1 family)